MNPIGHNPLLRFAIAAFLITAQSQANQPPEQRMDLKTLITFLGFTEDESTKAVHQLSASCDGPLDRQP